MPGGSLYVPYQSTVARMKTTEDLIDKHGEADILPDHEPEDIEPYEQATPVPPHPDEGGK